VSNPARPGKVEKYQSKAMNQDKDLVGKLGTFFILFNALIIIYGILP
jgi:hypothetical protein